MRGCGNLLPCSLWLLDFHLETEWLITGWTIFWVATYGFITNINSTCLWHMSLWFPWLQQSLSLLVTEACEVPILLTRFALKLLGWTLETFNVIQISTLLTSLLVVINILGIKAFLVMALPITCIILMTGCSRLYKGFPLLVLACWEVCIDVSSNWSEPPGGHLPPAWCAWTVTLELSMFFGSYLTLLVGNLSRSMLLSLIVSVTNSSSFKKNQKMSLWRLLAWGT